MRYIILSALFAFSTGCGLTAHSGEHFQMSGSPEGIRAFGDTLIGAVKTGKEGPDAPNQYFISRERYEAQETVRKTSPGLFQRLFSKQEGK